MQNLEIGVITKPQGLRGEFRVKMYNHNFAMLKGIKFVVVKNQQYKILSKIDRTTFVVFKLENVNSIDTVEPWRNIPISICKEEVNLKSNEYIADEIVGYNVFNSNNKVGTVVSVENFGADDVFTIKNGNEEFLFPNVLNVISKIDNAKKIIYVNEKILEEIIVKE